MKYRKKPVVIDAWPWPDGPQKSITTVGDNLQFIDTLEGIMRREPGDWLIRGVKGEYYPCKSDIFEMTYEPAKM